MWFKKLWYLCYYCWCDGGYAMLSSIRVLIWLFRVWTAKTPSERTLLVSKKETAFFSRSLTLFFWFSSSSYHFSSIYFAHFVACHNAMMCHHRHNCNNKPNQSIYFLLTLFFLFMITMPFKCITSFFWWIYFQCRYRLEMTKR